MKLERYSEASKYSAYGLTYPAFVGTRKQSVEDIERLFSSSLLHFMEQKGYEYEAAYIGAVLGWREACDKRGLTEKDKTKKNYQMLTFLLKELMPLYKHDYDFSLLEVDR